MNNVIQSLNSLFQNFSSLTSFLFSLIGFIISVLTLWVAWLAYTKYIKHKLLEKQLDVVINLIELLRDSKFFLTFHINYDSNSLSDYQKSEISQYETLGLKGGTRILEIEKNMFELVNLSNNSLFKMSRIFVDISLTQSSKQQIDSFTRFSSNPIMPRAIAQVLKNFKISDETFTLGLLGNPHKSSSFVCFGQRQENNVSDISGFCDNDKDGVAFTSWENFIQACQSLSKSIKKWMKDHGITDVNL